VLPFCLVVAAFLLLCGGSSSASFTHLPEVRFTPFALLCSASRYVSLVEECYLFVLSFFFSSVFLLFFAFPLWVAACAMFVVHASYASLLWAVCRRLANVSVDRLTEILEDG
jgi:hypothetical protein